MQGKREYWVDNVKVIACVLVVIGHFFQSMVKAEIIPDSVFYQWFNKTIYHFHVQLFFICSGYLYQKISDVHSFKSWFENIKKKLIVLGVPYITFSCVTWVLKTVFSSSVNSNIESLPHILLVVPEPPYWYLYTLFFLFVITITIKSNKEMYILLCFALLGKILRMAGFTVGLYFVDKTMDFWIWFVLGIAIAFGLVHIWRYVLGILAGIAFVGFSVIYYQYDKYIAIVDFILGFMACGAVLSIVKFFLDKRDTKLLGFIGKYTMPIFLMHTLFAAAFRAVLLKLGVSNVLLHVLFGLIISFGGPIIAMMILEKLRPMDFIVYPGRYLRTNKTR